MSTEGHGYTCSYCTGDGGGVRQHWQDRVGFVRHMATRHHGLPYEAERSAGAAPLDVELLARAIWHDHYSDSDDENIQDWQRDLNNSVEMYDNPREWAERIAARYARLAEGTDR